MEKDKQSKIYQSPSVQLAEFVVERGFVSSSEQQSDFELLNLNFGSWDDNSGAGTSQFGTSGWGNNPGTSTSDFGNSTWDF